MSQLGAKTIVNRLIQHGIKTVFGVSGGAILPVLDQFYKHNNINFIQSRTELGAGFMAEGYAKSTRSPGVVMVTSGPGAINTMTSLQNALSDGTPILALTGQVSTTVLGTDAFQEANIMGISKPCTKWNFIIKDGTLINRVIDNAFLHMLNKRHGPVLIDLPKNIMSSKIEQRNSIALLKKNKLINNSTINIEDIFNMINKSNRPVILCGQGVIQANAIELLRRFATRTYIPVTTTLMGLGVFPEKNIQSLKMLGMHGSYYANMAIQNCDLLLNFGSRFDDRIIGDPSKFAPNAKIIHIDIENKNINKVIKTPYYINDDCKKVLEKLLDIFVDENYNLEYNPYLYQIWYKQIYEWKKIDFSYPKKSVLQGRQVIKMLNNIIQNDVTNKYTIIADVGAHQMWAAQFIDYDYPKVKWLTSGGLGSMGYAVPASIGVKISIPETKEKVICICGDGGFTMSLIEILTAIENKVNIKVLIINNGYQLMVKMWQEKFYNNQLIGVKMNNPPFEEVCKSMGCHSIKIEKNDNIIEKLNYIVNYEDGPIVCNIITDENEKVLPMVSPGKALDDMIINEDNYEQKFTGDAPC
jgi:acetolactate synthase-1/2/3 large subunit